MTDADGTPANPTETWDQDQDRHARFVAEYGATVALLDGLLAPYGAALKTCYFGWDASAKEVPKVELEADVALWAWLAVQMHRHKASASKRLLPLDPAVVEPLRRVAIATQATAPPVIRGGLQPAPRPAATEFLPLEQTGVVRLQTLIGETELNAVVEIAESFPTHRAFLARLNVGEG